MEHVGLLLFGVLAGYGCSRACIDLFAAWARHRRPLVAADDVASALFFASARGDGIRFINVSWDELQMGDDFIRLTDSSNEHSYLLFSLDGGFDLQMGGIGDTQPVE